MSWAMFDECSLMHSSGATITLVCGTWQQPIEINPKIPDVIDAVDQADLIRQGIYFARQQSDQHARAWGSSPPK